jgi:hypothetical protein
MQRRRMDWKQIRVVSVSLRHVANQLICKLWSEETRRLSTYATTSLTAGQKAAFLGCTTHNRNSKGYHQAGPFSLA